MTLPERPLTVLVAALGGEGGGVLVVGVDRLLTQLSKCCKPVPPDPVRGFVTRGKGVSIHREDCPSLKRLAERHPERLIEAQWDGKAGGAYAVDMAVTASERPGLLRDIGDARIAIEETISGVGAIHESPLPVGGETPPLQPQGERRAPLHALPWAVSAAAILVGLAGLAGWWFGTRSVPSPPKWSGELLPGPTVAFWPRISPDAHLLAFQAIVAGISQVAVMDPASGNWTLLTDETTH